MFNERRSKGKREIGSKSPMKRGRGVNGDWSWRKEESTGEGKRKKNGTSTEEIRNDEEKRSDEGTVFSILHNRGTKQKQKKTQNTQTRTTRPFQTPFLHPASRCSITLTTVGPSTRISFPWKSSGHSMLGSTLRASKRAEDRENKRKNEMEGQRSRWTTERGREM